MYIKKGDQVKIVAGKDRGKVGTVLRTIPSADRIVVEGINLFKKRTRPKKQGDKGETVLLPRPLNASNVLLVCKNCKAPARMGFRREGDKKTRYCKKCQALND